MYSHPAPLPLASVRLARVRRFPFSGNTVMSSSLSTGHKVSSFQGLVCPPAGLASSESRLGREWFGACCWSIWGVGCGGLGGRLAFVPPNERLRPSVHLPNVVAAGFVFSRPPYSRMHTSTRAGACIVVSSRLTIYFHFASSPS
jgi:hypothetical protein